MAPVAASIQAGRASGHVCLWREGALRGQECGGAGGSQHSALTAGAASQATGTGSWGARTSVCRSLACESRRCRSRISTSTRASRPTTCKGGSATHRHSTCKARQPAQRPARTRDWRRETAAEQTKHSLPALPSTALPSTAARAPSAPRLSACAAPPPAPELLRPAQSAGCPSGTGSPAQVVAVGVAWRRDRVRQGPPAICYRQGVQHRAGARLLSGSSQAGRSLPASCRPSAAAARAAPLAA